jgi:hypothetical protein
VGVEVEGVELGIEAEAETGVVEAGVELGVEIESWIEVEAGIEVVEVEAWIAVEAGIVGRSGFLEGTMWLSA